MAVDSCGRLLKRWRQPKQNIKMRLIADSGSTKTEWALTDKEQLTAHVFTQGINPFHQSSGDIEGIVRGELLPRLAEAGFGGDDVTAVSFYGAGCMPATQPDMQRVLTGVFTQAHSIEVAGDLLAAARSLCRHERGVAAILGTGANSCLYDGVNVVANIPPLGYIMGDEGSGAVLGKLFFNALYKGFLPIAVRECFEDEVKMTYPQVIQRVYREPMANRFLASVSPFIARHKAQWPELSQLVVDNFRAFFRRNISRYQFSELPVNATGSVAFAYQNELSAAARAEGYVMGKIEKQPMPGLIAFHADC